MIATAMLLFLTVSPPDVAIHPVQATAPIEIEIKQGKVVGQRTIRARQGDEVTLRVASDRALDLHLHGYDIERTAAPGMPAVFTFTARATGRFPMETHEPAEKGAKNHSHGASMFYLEVLPR